MKRSRRPVHIVIDDSDSDLEEVARKEVPKRKPAPKEKTIHDVFKGGAKISPAKVAPLSLEPSRPQFRRTEQADEGATQANDSRMRGIRAQTSALWPEKHAPQNSNGLAVQPKKVA
eukprot:CAMPEP_0118928746 /NCGR_PEP_ID=MMETSP1169-20130426/5924_1 /TAXON_ID=36882 /ORGANISM="Pyramimonas obovata, Strain CCMP722" /LENGTH=115 /DNA_ID=CAMNT_0006870793 /DNA_START=256 /DNA_END=599 /DNA_ORIENTATION=-